MFILKKYEPTIHLHFKAASYNFLFDIVQFPLRVMSKLLFMIIFHRQLKKIVGIGELDTEIYKKVMGNFVTKTIVFQQSRDGHTRMPNVIFHTQIRG